jgi:hypothetical protein
MNPRVSSTCACLRPSPAVPSCPAVCVLRLWLARAQQPERGCAAASSGGVVRIDSAQPPLGLLPKGPFLRFSQSAGSTTMRSVLLQVLALLALLALLHVTTPLENGLGRKPLMGWSSWNAFAASGALNETAILRTMDALVERPAGGPSLFDRGYRYVNLDDGIVLAERDSAGVLVVDTKRFPRGLAFLSKEAHSRGLLFGVYTARGPRTCCGKAGSLGHERIDAQTYADDWQIVSRSSMRSRNVLSWSF